MIWATLFKMGNSKKKCWWTRQVFNISTVLNGWFSPCNGVKSISLTCKSTQHWCKIVFLLTLHPQFSEFSPGAPQTWLREKRKAFSGDTYPSHAPLAGGPHSQFSGQKGFKSYRATFTFSGPRIDKYHWVSKSRSWTKTLTKNQNGIVDVQDRSHYARSKSYLLGKLQDSVCIFKGNLVNYLYVI